MQYAALPDRPEEPAVRSPLAPVLGLLLRLFNAALGLAALGLLGYAFVLDWRYNHTGGGSGDDPGGSPAPETAVLFGSQLGGGGSRNPIHGPNGQLAPLVVDLTAQLAKKAAVASFPWFIYAMALAGFYTLGTAYVGDSGVRLSSRWRVALYIGLLSMLILAEAAVLLLLFTSNDWRERIPGDPSGTWEAAQSFFERNSSAVKVVCLLVMAAELVALAAASWLHSLQQVAYEQWLDDREEAEARQREVLQQTVLRQYQGGPSSLWTQRMRQKYGVDQSQVQSEVAAVRRVAALSNDLPPGSSL